MHVSEDIERQLRELVRVFLEVNSKVNLSAFRTEERCWVGNILDSIALLDVPGIRSQLSIAHCQLLDVGTGGGFPLLPLAITLPDVHVVGVDSTRKKIEAVRRIVRTLQLHNVELIWGRAEEFGQSDVHREHYDVVTIRAVKKIAENLTLAAPFVKPGGMIVLWKSMNIAKEISDAQPTMAKFSYALEGRHEYELSERFGKRQLLLFRHA